MFFQRLLIILTIFFSGKSSSHEQSYEWLLKEFVSGKHEVLAPLFPLDGSRIKIVVEADVPDVHEELIRILGIDDAGYGSLATFAEGLRLLAKQQHFAQVNMSKIAGEERCLVVHFIAAWLVERVVISGTLIGKDRMKQAYVLVPGDIFDQVKHEAGISRIKKLLREEGYLASAIEVSYEDDERYKLRTIYVCLQQGSRFYIKDIRVNLDAIEHISQEDGRLQRRLRKLLQHALVDNSYEKSLVNHATQLAQEELIDRGFLGNKIRLKESIDHTKNCVHLQFYITIGNQRTFEFYGNHFFSRKQLIEQLMLFGSSTTLIPPALLAEELSALYKKHGFWQVAITWSEDASRTFFFIQEGTRLSITSIELHGVTFLPLEDVVKTYLRHMIGIYLDNDRLKDALESLMQRYLEEGFWDAELVNYEYQAHPHGGAKLIITVREGERRWLRAVELDDRWTCIPAKMRTYMDLGAPIPFNIHYIKEQRQLLTEQLRREGRLYASVEPELLADTRRGLTVRWRRSGLDAVVHIGPTIICGNGRVLPEIILRECVYTDGDVWDSKKLEMTSDRLKNLGIFKTVSVVPDDITAQETTKGVIIHCVPDELYEVRARIGVQGVNRNVVKWNGGGSPKVGLSLIAKNPSGNGDTARFDLDYTRYMHDAIFAYRVPWVGSLRLDSEWQLYSSRYDQPIYLGSPEVLYRASRDGFLVNVNRPFDTWTVGLSAGCVWEKLEIAPCGSCTENPCCTMQRALLVGRSIDASPLLFGKKYAHLFFETTVMRDTRDNQLNPRSGAMTVFSVRAVTPPGLKEGSFLKLLLEQSWFVPIRKETTAGFRIRGGILVGADFDRVMPIERFYLGGAYSLRSYAADYAPPLRSFLPCSGKQCFVPTGGNIMLNTMFELRFPLYKYLSGVLFTDCGLLSAQGVRVLVKPHNLMGAIGGGLRLNTPVGAIRFDVGVKLHRDVTVDGIPVQDKRYAWFLTLGQAF